MTSNVDGWHKRYENLERACSQSSCLPCTYPDCQRFVREKRSIDRAIGKIGVVKKKASA